MLRIANRMITVVPFYLLQNETFIREMENALALRVCAFLRIVDAETNEVLNLSLPGVWAAVQDLPVSRFGLAAMPEGLAALENAQQGPLAIFAVIGFGRVGKSTTLNTLLASLCE